MAFLTGQGIVSEIDLYKSELIPAQTVGSICWDGNTGKAYRYVLNGASALVKGNLLQEAVNDTQFDALAVNVAGVVGDQFLTLTNGSTTVVPFLFRGGSVSCNTAGATVAVGDEYTVTDITGVLTTGGAIKVWLDRPLRYAYPTATTKVQLHKSPWGGVIQHPGTQTGIPAGVAIYEIPASTATVPVYGWVQTHGVASVLSDGSTFAIGSDVSAKSGTAGCITVGTAGTTFAHVGVSMHAAESTKAIPVFLQID